ncbi:hypothetical protein BWQ96_00864 [Gracilariopsis chorda]|uniref:Uncharacterized protein n=1 Tax=Gracilariopsis chorda TaxID=448386 RepID=A0A2V3J7S9_9FLOR|nr:hypothetical protein BWQ96_00864 [Gracilariopsis chorda]|eukprot:PXF49290.1 hypothetical protein BWQ96_00864 [Gracilariopsis chorda]
MYLATAFFVILVTRTFARAPKCTSTIGLNAFLSTSFLVNADLIRFGVPSEVVTKYYDRAVMDVARFCNCSSVSVDETCVQLIFEESLELSLLKGALDADSLLSKGQRDQVSPTAPENKVKLFPLYDPGKTLSGLSSTQTEELNSHLTRLLSASKSVVSIQSEYWQRSRFPSDETFFQDTYESQKAACGEYQVASKMDNRTFPAWAATAYVIGLVQEVRKAQGEVSAAIDILAAHASFVFNGARCYRVNGLKLHIPVRKMEEYLATAQKLLNEAGQRSHPIPLNDIRKVSESSATFFPRLVTKLSSLSSNGDGRTVLVTDGTTIERALVNTLLMGDPLLLGEITLGPAAYECPERWIRVSRVLPLANMDEQCCPEKCEYAALSLSDPFLYTVTQEKCCELCNYFICKDHTLLPELKISGDGVAAKSPLYVSI